MDRCAYFCCVIKQLRYGIGASQSDLAEELGISQQTYSGYETGRHVPDLRFLIKLAQFYDVSLNYLFGY